jgi:hypothetical protein
MKTFRYARAYKKDLKRISRRGYDLTLLASVLDALRAGRPLPLLDAIIRSGATGRVGVNATSSPTGY